MKSTREILLTAADIIDTGGWASKESELWNNGKHCALTAIGFACNPIVDAPANQAAYWSARHALSAHIGTDHIASWNDAQPNKEVVTGALRAAAAKIQEGHTE